MPAVAEVVEIVERGAGRPVEVEEAHLALIEGAGVVVEAEVLDQGRIAVAQAADAELVQVIVPPVESRLDHEVKLAEVPCPGKDKASPDEGIDLGERDPDL